MNRLGDQSASHRPSRTTTLVAAALAVALTSCLVYIAAVAPRGVPPVGYYNVDAEFHDSIELKLLSVVAIDGKRVGQVSEIHSDGRLTHLNLQLDPGTSLRTDATARIRVKNLVGARYVDLTPGKTGGHLPDGGTLPASQTSVSVDTPDLLSTFDAPTRHNLTVGVQGLGRGFLGRGQQINEVLPEAPGLLRDFSSVSGAVLARRGAARRFFPSAESLASAYDPVRHELAQGFDPEAKVFEAFADSRPQLQDTLAAAPPAESALRAGLDKARPLLDATAAFARATARLTVPAPRALRAATDLLRTGAPALRRTQPLLSAVGDSVDPTIAALDALRPEIRPTERSLRDQLPPLVELARRPCDVLLQAKTWRSALGFGVPVNADPTSDLDHSEGIGPNNNSFRVLGVDTTAEAAFADTPAAAAQPIASDAYPAPCQATNESVPLLPTGR
jgi:virulence factor Mce-like protein